MPALRVHSPPRIQSSAFGLTRLARTVALAVILAIALVNVYWAVKQWTLSDASAYWQAGLRLRDGLPLYPSLSSVDASDVYRYAPWFAWVTVPVTYLPIQVAGALWSAVLLAASAWALMPLIRIRAWLLVAFFGPILLGISAVGNVQALLVAALVHGIERRSGPLWIAIAASLKVTPIVLALVYLGRRQWGRASATVALAGLLWAPAVLYDLSHYATDAGQASSLVAVPVLFALVLLAAIGVTVAFARTRFGWLAGATTVVLALPRLFVYDVTFLILGVLPATRSAGPTESNP